MARLSRAKARVKRPVRNHLKAAMEGDPEVLASIAAITSHPEGVMGYFVEATVKRARAGETDAALEILDQFIQTVNQRSQRSWEGPLIYQYAKFLADAFQKILDGTKADLALGIKSSKPGRRQAEKTAARLEAIAAGFELLTRRGFSHRQATNALEAYFGRRTIQRARADNPWMDDEHLFSDETLKVTLKPIAPIIARILDAKKRR